MIGHFLILNGDNIACNLQVQVVGINLRSSVALSAELRTSRFYSERRGTALKRRFSKSEPKRNWSSPTSAPLSHHMDTELESESKKDGKKKSRANTAFLSMSFGRKAGGKIKARLGSIIEDKANTFDTAERRLGDLEEKERRVSVGCIEEQPSHVKNRRDSTQQPKLMRSGSMFELKATLDNERFMTAPYYPHLFFFSTKK